MTLVEVIVGIGLLVLVFAALFGGLRAALELALLARAKAVATELSSAQVEYLHSLDYTALGTVGGTPSGSVPVYATSTVNGAPYVLQTAIVYHDDEKDGVGGADADGNTQDYKKASVITSFEIHGRASSVALSSIFAPN